MATTLTASNGKGPFTFQEGDIREIEYGKTAEIDDSPLYGLDSNQTFLFDTNGAKRTIIVTGELHDAAATVVSGETVTTAVQMMAWLNTNILNGNQGGGHAFSSRLTTTSAGVQTSITVMIDKISFKDTAGESEHIPFTISMVEGYGA